jgi:hypothetical protein
MNVLSVWSVCSSLPSNAKGAVPAGPSEPCYLRTGSSSCYETHHGWMMLSLNECADIAGRTSCTRVCASVRQDPGCSSAFLIVTSLAQWRHLFIALVSWWSACVIRTDHASDCYVADSVDKLNLCGCFYVQCDRIIRNSKVSGYHIACSVVPSV